MNQALAFSCQFQDFINRHPHTHNNGYLPKFILPMLRSAGWPRLGYAGWPRLGYAGWHRLGYAGWPRLGWDTGTHLKTDTSLKTGHLSLHETRRTCNHTEPPPKTD